MTCLIFTLQWKKISDWEWTNQEPILIHRLIWVCTLIISIRILVTSTNRFNQNSNQYNQTIVSICNWLFTLYIILHLNIYIIWIFSSRIVLFLFYWCIILRSEQKTFRMFIKLFCALILLGVIFFRNFK